eukprot:1283176-Rhodomonas_salina.1
MECRTWRGQESKQKRRKSCEDSESTLGHRLRLREKHTPTHRKELEEVWGASWKTYRERHRELTIGAH